MHVGKAYYFIVSPWLHLIARLDEVTGKQMGRISDVVFVYSCRRDWTAFFRDGPCRDSVLKHFPPGEISWSAAFDWGHPIPSPESA